MKNTKILIASISLALILLNSFANAKKASLTFLHESEKGAAEKISYSLYLSDSNNSFNVKPNVYDENALAFCTYEESLMQKGWDYLALSAYQGSDSKYSDEQKALGMGFLEGFITADKIWYNYQNQKKYTYGQNKNSANGEMPENVKTFLNKNFQFIKIEGKKNYQKDPYWQHAYLIYIQMEGLLDGYNTSVSNDSYLISKGAKQLSLADLQVINAAGVIGNWNILIMNPLDLISQK